MTTGQVFLPPASATGALDGPLIFLAGPIQGAPAWHGEAMRLLHAGAPTVNVASPKRRDETGFVYAEQVDWETGHLRRAAAHGVILFWLAREAAHTCGRAYAQTTRFELAEWKMRHERDGALLAVGIEEGFSGARYIRRRLSQDCPAIPIRDTLAATCAAALALLGLGG